MKLSIPYDISMGNICPTQRAPDPRKSTGTIVVGVCAFSGTVRSFPFPSLFLPSRR